MEYVVQKHEKGLAIITWCIDEDYQCSSEHMFYSPESIYYMLFVNIYDPQGNLIQEDGIGGIDIQHETHTDEFRQEVINSYEFHFKEISAIQ